MDNRGIIDLSDSYQNERENYHNNEEELLGKQNASSDIFLITLGTLYSKTCLKRPLKNRQNKYINDKW